MTETRTLHSTYKGYDVTFKETTTSNDTRYSYKISHDKLPVEIFSTRLWTDKRECIEVILSLIDDHIRNHEKQKALQE